MSYFEWAEIIREHLETPEHCTDYIKYYFKTVALIFMLQLPFICMQFLIVSDRAFCETRVPTQVGVSVRSASLWDQGSHLRLVSVWDQTVCETGFASQVGVSVRSDCLWDGFTLSLVSVWDQPVCETRVRISVWCQCDIRVRISVWCQCEIRLSVISGFTSQFGIT